MTERYGGQEEVLKMWQIVVKATRGWKDLEICDCLMFFGIAQPVTLNSSFIEIEFS